MTNLLAIDNQLDAEAGTCRVIIETPKGQRGKLTYDPDAGAFKLKRMLPDGMTFPLDFGFIPSTLGEDGDPLDILVMNDEPGTVGMLLDVRLIGVIEAIQTEDEKTIRNDRIIAVAQASNMFEKVEVIGDLGVAFRRNLTQFWTNYAALRGTTFEVIRTGNAVKAARLIAKANVV